MGGVQARAKSVYAFLKRHPRAFAAAEALTAAAVIALICWSIRGSFKDAGERLSEIHPVDIVLACVALAAYYLAFVVGWIWILAAWGIRISYPAALGAEMVSMLAKYVPGGVWTPAARVVAARRAGITQGGLVTASMLVEAGLSAVSGVLVFVISLAWVGEVDAPTFPILAFGAVIAVLLHPRIFQPLSRKLLGRFGYEVPPLPTAVMVKLLLYYAFTWLIGGLALWFMIRAVGAYPSATTIPFLGGTSAVGAIVAVIAFFTPSGLGAREGAMGTLLKAVISPGAALATVVLNRLAITIVEILLLVVGGLVLRVRGVRMVGELETVSEP
jgi:uncharacterized membrane protein YbhN (UPF0104 family)